ncbi:MAG: 50S ribosomal protein L9 [Phycisphaerae bacterium]
MKLLLVRDVRKLGHVGDVVEVKLGYARNYLLPQRVAVEPSEENLRSIESLKKKAAEERARKKQEFGDMAARLKDVQVTIEAAANPEGTLYGSVGAKEIAAALQAMGHAVLPEHVMLDRPIRTLDNRMVTLEFTEDVTLPVKVWVVREGGAGDVEGAESGESGDAAAQQQSDGPQ